jgi:hypothetical protein
MRRALTLGLRYSRSSPQPKQMAVDKKSTCKPLDMAQLDNVFLGFRGEFQGLPQAVMLMELWSPLAKENEEPMIYVVLYSEFFWRVREGTFGGSPPPSPKKNYYTCKL